MLGHLTAEKHHGREPHVEIVCQRGRNRDVEELAAFIGDGVRDLLDVAGRAFPVLVLEETVSDPP